MAEIKAEVGASGASASAAPSRKPGMSRRQFIGRAAAGVAGAAAAVYGAKEGAVRLMSLGVQKEKPETKEGGSTEKVYEMIDKGIEENRQTLQQSSLDLQGQTTPEEVTKKLVSPYLGYYDDPKSSEKDTYVHFFEIGRPGPILLAATEGPTWYARPALKKELESLAGRSITDQELKEMQTSQQKSIAFLTGLYQEGKISQQALDFYSQTSDQLLQQAKKQFPRFFH
ncbi:MAG: twin-arginine translocation signal domain-containing protein [Candidatus Shapirobacteria bacterium]